MILLWGSNARETHPIFFHHLLEGRPQRGAAVRHRPPAHGHRRSGPTCWLGLDVGTDIALSNAMAREIIHAGLANGAFIDHATDGLRAIRGVRRAVHARVRASATPASLPT